MATETQLVEALRRADAAGATDDARRLAQAIGSMRKQARTANLDDQGRAVGSPGFDPVTAVNPGMQAAGSDPNALSTTRHAAPGYSDPLGKMAGLVSNAYQGATLNFGDEIAGAGGGLVTLATTGEFGPGYRAVRDEVRGLEKGFAEANPEAALIANVGGGLATGLAALPRALLSGSRHLGARMGGAAITGSGIGGLAGFGAGEDGIGGRLSSAAEGAAIGGVFGAAAEGGASALARVWRARPARMLDSAGRPTPAALALADEAGVPHSMLTPELLGRFDAVATRGGAAGVPGSGNAAMAEMLPVPVPLSRGQATDDVGLLARERGLARGAEGDRAMAIMRAFDQDQQTALRANVPALRERIAGNGPVVERGQGGEIISNRLNAARDVESTRASELYDRARASGTLAELPELAARDAVRRVDERVHADHAWENVPKVYREMQNFINYVGEGNVPVRSVFETRARLTGIRSGGGEDAVAAGKAIREIDDVINDALDQSLITGDSSAVAAWREAISNYRGYADVFKRRDLVGRLVERDYRNGGRLKVAPEEAVNTIFGTADLGLVSRRDLARDLIRLRDVLGPESDGWSVIRQQAFNRVADRGLGASGPSGRDFSGANFANAWEDLNRKNPELARTLFSADERRDIGNFANVARRVTTQDKAVYAPSTSPYQMRRVMSAFAKRVPLVGEWLGQGIENTAGLAAAARSVSGRLDRPAQPLVGGPAAALGGTLALQ